ncbi:TonB family protein [Vibrio sp. MA40-2]|uniref:energy transducer TonB n=1 Tax=Vibrio sp. MA40-2 TaxID=3391828 RepID=UPI0039A41004
MRLSSALIFSILVHISVVALWLRQDIEPVTKNSQMSLDAVDFDLGILAAQTESVIEQKANSEEQAESKAGSLASVAPPVPTEVALESNIEREKKPEPKETSKPEKVQPEKLAPEEIIEVVKAIPLETVADEVTSDKTPLPEGVKPKTIQAKSRVQEKQKRQPKLEVSYEETTVPKKVKQEKVSIKPELVAQKQPKERQVAKDKPAITDSTEGSQSVDAQRSIKQASEATNRKSTGGKASSSEATNKNAASYISGLQRKIANSANRMYPKKAQRNNQQGVIKVSFYLLEDGTIEKVAIVEESKFTALNKAAVKAVKRVKKYKPLPEGINNYFVIPISFKLR